MRARLPDVAQLAQVTLPDVVVMDLHLQDGSGLDAAVVIRCIHPNARFVFLTRDESDTAWLAAVEAGASAFIHKSRAATDVIDAVRRAGNGASLITPSSIATLLGRNREIHLKRESLSPREREVLRLMAEGRQAARSLRNSGSATRQSAAHSQHRNEAGRPLEARGRGHSQGTEPRRVTLRPGRRSGAAAERGTPASCHGPGRDKSQRKLRHGPWETHAQLIRVSWVSHQGASPAAGSAQTSGVTPSSRSISRRNRGSSEERPHSSLPWGKSFNRAHDLQPEVEINGPGLFV
jgi:FixJ family two-component response regulator